MNKKTKSGIKSEDEPEFPPEIMKWVDGSNLAEQRIAIRILEDGFIAHIDELMNTTPEMRVVLGLHLITTADFRHPAISETQWRIMILQAEDVSFQIATHRARQHVEAARMGHTRRPIGS